MDLKIVDQVSVFYLDTYKGSRGSVDLQAKLAVLEYIPTNLVGT